jgi:hypothetical protein
VSRQALAGGAYASRPNALAQHSRQLLKVGAMPTLRSLPGDGGLGSGVSADFFFGHACARRSRRADLDERLVVEPEHVPEDLFTHSRFGRGRGKGIAPRFTAVLCIDCGIG